MRETDIVDTEIDAVGSVVNGNTDSQLLLRPFFDSKASVENLSDGNINTVAGHSLG